MGTVTLQRVSRILQIVLAVVFLSAAAGKMVDVEGFRTVLT
ncbi:MAG: hypothetical protein ACR2GY_07500 [Phycisphaerales bacterium]